MPALRIIGALRHVHIGSASLPIALNEARREGMIKMRSLAPLVAFGSGFVWGSALMRM